MVVNINKFTVHSIVVIMVRNKVVTIPVNISLDNQSLIHPDMTKLQIKWPLEHFQAKGNRPCFFTL